MSIDFALNALSNSVQVIVVLGHSGCGAVTGTVDAYLRPLKFWSKSIGPMLRTLTKRIFVAVRETADGLDEDWGADSRDMSGYTEALIEFRCLLERRPLGLRSPPGGGAQCEVGDRSVLRRSQLTQSPGVHACRSPVAAR